MIVYYNWYEKFQSTPLREGRPVLAILTDTQIEFQSTPLREGRQEIII